MSDPPVLVKIKEDTSEPVLHRHSRDPGDLRENQVHIHLLRFADVAERIDNLASNLTALERARADRMLPEPHRNRFIATQGMLRAILGRYLEEEARKRGSEEAIEPAGIELAQNSYGKPELGDSFNGKRLEFNISHSRDIGLFIFTVGLKAGIDVEQLDRRVSMDNIAGRFFHANEANRLRELPPQEKRAMFFHYWTCKEAFFKANGTGIGAGLDRLDCTGIPQAGSCRIVGNDEEARERGSENVKWICFCFVPVPGSIGAAVIERTDAQLEVFQIDCLPSVH